jgi:N-acetylmuramic acid 6-phosphate etherase
MYITETSGKYENLEKKSLRELLIGINEEDKTVPLAIEKEIPKIELLALAVLERMKLGGRLFYIGAGTSGRLGVVDASECPPTYGVPFDWVVGIIAGGDGAIRKAVEFAEDNAEQAWKDLLKFDVNSKDIVVGIAASGKTPYVYGGLKACQTNGITTGSISCNPNAKISEVANFPVEIVTGPEFVTGSTRMKAGTAQKMVLNMISTSVMIGLGRVKGNKMVDMQLTNYKLFDRGIQMLVDELKVSPEDAKIMLQKHGNVRQALENYKN